MSFRAHSLSALVAFVFAAAAPAATITVNTTADDAVVNGNCTLREAIMAANTNAAVDGCAAGSPQPAVDTILFAFPSGTAPFTINVGTTPLPTIIEPVFIDGYSAAGAVQNTAVAAFAPSAQPGVELNGIAVVGPSAPGPVGQTYGLHLSFDSGLSKSSSGSTVRGLIINRFPSAGMRVDTSNNVITGNFIGVNAAGTARSANGTSTFAFGGAIIIWAFDPGANVSHNRVGGHTPAERNLLVPGDNGEAIWLASDIGGGDANIIEGNLIGTDRTGTAVFSGVTNAGIRVQGPTNTLIGGTSGVDPTLDCRGACNLVSGNEHGMFLWGAGSVTTPSTNGTIVQGNFIGTDVTGMVALGNGTTLGYGIHCAFAITDLHIGGTTVAERNLISGGKTGASGIQFESFDPADRVNPIFVQGNWIGVNRAGGPLGNAASGIVLHTTSDVTIGGAAPGAGNVIAANGDDGVFDEGGHRNTIQGNLIGILPDGVTAAGNGKSGVTVAFFFSTSSDDNTISGNTIANNGTQGVFINIGNQNLVSANSIYSNGGLGIDIDNAGPTANDHCDTDFDADPFHGNRGQNFPVLSSAVTDGATQTTVGGSLDSHASTTFTIEFFAGPAAASPQARTFLGSTTVVTGADCTGSFSATLPHPTPAGWQVTATATDPVNNTSELAAAIPATVLVPPSYAKSFAPATINTGQTSTLTITITNPNAAPIGGVGFTDTFPGGLVVAASPSATNSCGGTFAPASGAGSISLSGGSIAASSACSVTVLVTSSTPGSYMNSVNGASATLTVRSPIAVSKSFTPDTIYVGLTSTLTITLTNANASAVSVSISDEFPANLTGSNLTSDCAGAALTGGGTGVSFNGSVAASSTCTITVDATSVVVGTYVNNIAASANSTAATATLIVQPPVAPTAAKSFSPSTVHSGFTTTLTITLTNPNGIAVTGVSFVDNYPSRIINTPSGASTTCGGTVDAKAGARSVSLTGGTIPPSDSCTVTVLVRGVSPGTYTNTIPAGAITTANTPPNGAAASATLTVVDSSP